MATFSYDEATAPEGKGFGYEDAANTKKGAVARGAEAAMRQVPQTLAGTLALAADAVGAKGVRDFGLGVYKGQEHAIQSQAQPSDSFSNVLEGADDASVGEFLKYGVGYTGGQAAQAVLTGGVGGFVGRKLAQRGIEAGISKEAAALALNKGTTAGAGAALGAGNFIQEAGSIYPEAVDEAAKTGQTLTGGDLARVTGAAALAAGVETLTDTKMLKGVLQGASDAPTYLKRAVRTVPAAVGREAGTEAVQTGIERVGAAQSLTDKEAIRDYVDSAALGGVGGAMGGAASAIKRGGETVVVDPNAGPTSRAAAMLAAPVVHVDGAGRAKMDGVPSGGFDSGQMQGLIGTTDTAPVQPGPPGEPPVPPAAGLLAPDTIEVGATGEALTADQRHQQRMLHADELESENQRRQQLGLGRMEPDGAIVSPDGRAFRTRMGAERAARAEGPDGMFHVEPGNDGFRLRRTPVEDAAIKEEWRPFAANAGSLGLPRADMPQIKAEHRGAMVQFFKGRGITHESDQEIPATELKPTQAEFSPERVQKARDFTEGDRSILVSSDGHILDGHHQWMAKLHTNEAVKAIRLNAPIDQLLEHIKEFPSAQADQASVPDQAPEAAAPADIAPAGGSAQAGDNPAGHVPGAAPEPSAQPGADAQLAATPEEAATTVDNARRFGVGGKDMAEGGKPFKTKLGAVRYQREAKLKQTRAVSHPGGGFVLRQKTELEQLAEQAAGDRRLKASRSAAWEKNPLLAWLGQHGLYHVKGDQRSQKTEFSPDKNPMTPDGPLFRATGKHPDVLAAMAAQAGFLPKDSEDAGALSHLIEKVVRGERVAPIHGEGQAEQELQRRAGAATFDDFLQDEAGAPHDATVPAEVTGTRADLSLNDEDFNESGYQQASAQVQAQVRALVKLAEAHGIDSASILEDTAFTAHPTDEAYYAAALSALEQAIARSDEDRRAGAGQQGQAGTQGAGQSQALGTHTTTMAGGASPEAGNSGETPGAGNAETPPKKNVIADGRAKKEAAAHFNATVPEHVGVTDKELAQIVEEFGSAKTAEEDGELVTHVFDSPKPADVVRLADKVKVYNKDHGWMSVAQAKKVINGWEANAVKQGKTSVNSEKIVISLFDRTGKWSLPWEQAGYQVYRFDIQDEDTFTDPETGEEKKIGDVNNMSVEFFNDIFGSFDGHDVHAILAATPCTDFAVSGARHFAAKDADGRTVASVKLVHQTLNVIEYFKPAVWALENPVGRIEKLGGLPPWRLSFDPNHMGDPYTKKTLLWGRFNADLPIAPVEPTEGSKMHAKYGGKSQATKNARSETPEGFAYAFFQANNAVDNPLLAVAGKYDRLDRKAIKAALDAGVTPKQIDELVEDHYYQDLDDDAANKALRDAVAAGPSDEAQLRAKFPVGTRVQENRSSRIGVDRHLGTVSEAGDHGLSIDWDEHTEKSPSRLHMPWQNVERHLTIVDTPKNVIAAGRAKKEAKVLDPEAALNAEARKEARTPEARAQAAKLKARDTHLSIGQGRFTSLAGAKVLIKEVVPYDSGNYTITMGAKPAGRFDMTRAGAVSNIELKDGHDTPDTREAIEFFAAVHSKAYPALPADLKSSIVGAKPNKIAEGAKKKAAKETAPAATHTFKPGDRATIIDYSAKPPKPMDVIIERVGETEAIVQRASHPDLPGFPVMLSAITLAADAKADLDTAIKDLGAVVKPELRLDQPPLPKPFTATNAFLALNDAMMGGLPRVADLDLRTRFAERAIAGPKGLLPAGRALLDKLNVQKPTATGMQGVSTADAQDVINKALGEHRPLVQWITWALAPGRFHPAGRLTAARLGDTLGSGTNGVSVGTEPVRAVLDTMVKAGAVRKVGESYELAGPQDDTKKPTTTAPAAPVAAPAPATGRDELRAQADLKGALADLADLFGDKKPPVAKEPGASYNPDAPVFSLTQEQEQKLMPILARVFDAAFRLGKIRFKTAAQYVLQQIEAALGKDVADAITIDHLQGAYISMAGKYREQGADTAKAVVGVESKGEIEAHKENGDVSGTSGSVEPDSGQPAAGPAVGAAVSPERGQDGQRAGQGGEGARGDAGRQDDTRLPASGPALVGERGDQQLPGGSGAVGPASFAAGDLFGERGGDAGNAGAAPDAIPAASVRKAAGVNDERAKRDAQRAADGVKPIAGDRENIREALPYLLEGQQDDVLKAETRFAKPDGYGMVFTNGTGTGKTFTGLGIAKRFYAAGKKNILVVVPDQKILEDWVDSAKPLSLALTPLKDTKDAGRGPVITTYANLGLNDELAKRDWDLVIADEAHSLMQDANGTVTSYLQNLRAIMHHPDGVTQRYLMQNREEVLRQRALEQQVTHNNKEHGHPDTTEKRRAAITAENAKIRQQLDVLNPKLRAIQDDVKAQVQAKQGAARARLVGLSATPFAYEATIDWGNGYLFDYREDYPHTETSRGYNTPDPRSYFFQTHLGYRMRYGKLTKPDAKVDTGLMQRQFNGWLKKQGVLSGRMLDVPFDYDRKFVLVDSAIGNTIDEALDFLSTKASDDSTAKVEPSGWRMLRDHVNNQFDYLSRRYLLEAIKARESVGIVKAHMKLGRKVVVFHDYKKGGSSNPFDVQDLLTSNPDDTLRAKAVAYNAAAKEFREKYPTLLTELAGLRSPIEVFSKEFPGVLLINGDEKRRDLLARYKLIQDDATGPLVALVQSAKNKGWSGHDTTGKTQRVLLNLGQPTQPTLSIQQEGRIYRQGQASEAMFRYLNTGTNWEKWAFATTIAQRASTAENLSMGELARALKDAFIAGFEESAEFLPGHEGEGTGGKARDAAANNALTEYDRAKAFYWSTQKKTAKTKAQEGKDYFATPEPLGWKMAQWASAFGGEHVLEPSAGHGAIARWFPELASRTAIEPSTALRARLAMVFDGKIVEGAFEDHNVVNKYDAIVMNPPFGVGGKTAIDHLEKAASHLREGGRIVALIPRGPMADKRLESFLYDEKPAKPIYTHPKWGKLYKGDTVEMTVPGGGSLTMTLGSVYVSSEIPFAIPEGGNLSGAKNLNAMRAVSVEPGPRTETQAGLHLIADITLPTATFERAGTSVATHVIVLHKGEGAPQQINRDLSDVEDINALFDRLEHLDVAPRPEPVEQAPTTPASTPPPSTPQPPTRASAMAPQLPPAAPSEIVEVTTARGKVLRGIIRKDLTKEQAQAIDPFTWKPKGHDGFFIREKYLGGTTAREEQAVYQVRDPGANYDVDLFGTPDLLPTESAPPRRARVAAAQVFAAPQPIAPASPVLAVRKDAKLPGLYHVSSQLVSVGTKMLPVDKVIDWDSAAEALSAMSQYAVEHFDMLITDKDGKPLAVVGSFKGGPTQTSIYPGTVIMEALRIEGAAHAWAVHNHPAGMAKLSRADEALSITLGHLFHPSTIEYHGVAAVAAQPDGAVKWEVVDQDERPYSGEFTPGPAIYAVPIVERTITVTSKPEVMSTPSVAREHARLISGGRSGLMLLNAQSVVTGWIPHPLESLANPTKATYDRLINSMGEAGTTSVIIVAPDIAAGGQINGALDAAAQKLKASLALVDIRVLDAVDTVSGTSMAERGLMQPDDLLSGYDKQAALDKQKREEEALKKEEAAKNAKATPGKKVTADQVDLFNPQGGLFSRGAGGRASFTTSQLQAAVNKLTLNWLRKPAIHILESFDDAPEAVKRTLSQQDSHDASGRVEGFHHKGDVYLVRPNITSGSTLIRVLFHEALGHFGLRGAYGDALLPILRRVANLRAGDIARKALEYGLDARTDAGKLTAAEEVLAELAQTRPEIGFVRQAIAALRTWLRANVPGFDALKLSDDEILRDYLIPARNWVEQGAGPAKTFSMAAQFSQSGKWPELAAALERMNTDHKVTGRDLMDEVEGLIADDKAPTELQAAVNKFRADIQEDLDVWGGRGDMDGAEHEFVAAVDAALGNDAQFSRGFTTREIQVDGKWRPIDNSKGQPVGRTFEEQQAFWKWFGSSTVADDKGRPLVVYHGTLQGEIQEFDRLWTRKNLGRTKGLDQVGSWFSNNPTDDGGAGMYGSTIYPVYLAIDKPYVTTFRNLEEHAMESRPKGSKFIDADTLENLRADLKASGYDGIKLVHDPARADESTEFLKQDGYIAFEPAQIKSATGNRGTFDATSADVRFSLAGLGPLTPEQEQSLKDVGAIKKPVTLGERLAGFRQNLGLRIQQGVFDQFAPIKDASPMAYILARLSKGAEGTMEALLMYGKPFLRGGVPDVDMKDGGFVKVLAGLKGEHDRFLWWVAAQRAKRLKAQGKENLFTDTSIAHLLTLDQGQMADGSDRAAAFKTALAGLNEYNDAVLQMAVESGLIDEEARQLFKDQPYVPFYRVMEDEAAMSGPTFSSGLTSQYAYKKLKGGKEKLNDDLLHNMLLNWAHLYTAAARNRAALETMKAADQLAVAHQVNPHAGAIPKNAVKIRRDGKVEHWAVEDPYLLEAITALHYTPSPLMAPLVKAKKLMTFTVTANPAFKVRNLLRDSVAAMAMGDLSYNPIKNVAQGWRSSSLESQTYASMLASGGVMRFGNLEDSGRVRHKIAKLGGKLADEKEWSHITTAAGQLWDAYQELGDRGENVNRTALYEQLIAKGMTHAEASFRARDLMDFSMSGKYAVVRFLVNTVPFLNARLQGLYKLGRAGKEDPKRFAAISLAVSVASLALMAFYSGDDDWEKREDWDRDSYWWFKIGDTAFRIPKPFEVGAIGTLAERTAELFFSKEMTNQRFLDRLAFMTSQTFSLNPIPQAFSPLFDVYANRDAFLRRPIESLHDKSLQPKDRHDERTSEAARMLGSLGLPEPLALFKGEYNDLSPKQWDFLIHGYFSWIGASTASLTDYAVRPVMDRGERPDSKTRGGFVEPLPSGGSRYVTAFYEQAGKIEKAFASYRAALREGDTERAQQIVSEGKVQNHIAAGRVRKQLENLNAHARIVEASKQLTGEQKRAQLDQIDAARARIAKGYVRATP